MTCSQSRVERGAQACAPRRERRLRQGCRHADCTPHQRQLQTVVKQSNRPQKMTGTFVGVEQHACHLAACHDVQVAAAGVGVQVGVRGRDAHALALRHLPPRVSAPAKLGMQWRATCDADAVLLPP